MGIPAQQLETWSRRPDPSRSADTYAAIRRVLQQSDSVRKYEPDIYLQGSYANATNVRADSDVDVVCQLHASWRRDLTHLDADGQARYKAAFSNSDLSWAGFRREVLTALHGGFGPANVAQGSKCIKVAGSTHRLPTDVLVAQEYRLYLDFPSVADQDYIEGVTFWTASGLQIINYPKMHRTFGEVKQDETNDQYKRLVRTFKNARRRAVDDGLLSGAAAPSYFVECLLFNVPNSNFSNDLRATYFSALTWLCQHFDDFPQMKCQNRVVRLFGSGAEQWNVTDAERLVTALVQQWDSW